MKNKPREQIAIALFTGSVIAFFILLNELSNSLIFKIVIILILLILIFLSLKVIMDPSADLHFIGNILRKILNIRK